LKGQGTILLLDGLDESPNSRRRESMARLLEEAVTAYPKCRFVATTRPQSYTGAARLPGFKEVRIDELQPEAIEAFLGHWSRGLFLTDDKSGREHLQALGEALHARAAIRKMARNPVMLTALAVVHWNERRLPEQRADLYSSIVGWLARARENRPDRESSDRVLTLLGHLAMGMQNQPKGRIAQISKAAAAEIVAPHFREIADPDSRLERARAFLAAEEVDSGIFVSRGPDLRFWHLTLQEFLAARTIAGLTDSSQRELLFEGERLYRPEWREVMLLLGGLLIGQGADRVDGLFSAMLERADRGASLAEKARCAGLIGAMMSDLRPYSYNLADPRYEKLLHEALAIFDREKSRAVALDVRLAAAEALGQAGDPRLRLPKDADYWVSIPAGKFVMGEDEGDDEPRHEVHLDAFQIGRYPVTVYEYGVFLEEAEHNPPDGWEEQSLHPNRPVVNVSWFDAEAYCQWAAAKTKGVRLPTEAEWERAARGAGARRYAWGNAEPNPDLANYDKARVNSASPVGLFPQGSTPEPENIADLSGNVWEWVSDWYGASYYNDSPARNPKGPGSGDAKVLRGGSWDYDSTFLRAAYRIRSAPGDWYDGLGFRCAREVVFP
jgi:formylglycine-generating enzyme required for sulfatase activity